MTYTETLDWMFAQLPMYQQKGKQAFHGKLDGILNFSEHLNHPETKFKSIHVAGTNGKGSSSHMLAAVLQEAGYKVGLYTSPHLKDFRERIKINGRMVPETYVTQFIANNDTFFKTAQLSFFEMTVGMAFSYFAMEKVDVAIIEVGLGGRLDSTNIIVPEVSLITNIGYDHMDFLGNTLADIAKEKAGIMKENVPVVISEYQEETAETFMAEAKRVGAPISFADSEQHHLYATDLLGAYQVKNTKGVLSVIALLKDFEVNETQLKNGLKKVVAHTGLQGRWQQLGSNPTVICDTAHNKEGLSIVLAQLEEQPYTQLHIVLGVVSDKDLDAILPLFPKNALYYFCRPDIPRGLDEIVLAEKAKALGFKGNAYPTVTEAYKVALDAALETDFIYIGGSTFVVAEVV
ncbi:bifunctional folylpolyglutamate synthase/dihydrofolate synthase [Spongiimicrobium salis]|uniref:bifunctional folylpolyglutamate synthase/dihydrofolate synthase n=1 Tax=Spongiimicrobium salis TaxID=1667022 RepID=UPI00374CE584